MSTFTGSDVVTYRAITLKHGLKPAPTPACGPVAAGRCNRHAAQGQPDHRQTYRVGSIAQYRQAIADLQA